MNGIVEFAGGDEWGLVVSWPHVGLAIWWKEGMGNDTQYHFTLLYGPHRSNMIQEDAKDIRILIRIKPQTSNSFYHLHIQCFSIKIVNTGMQGKQEKIIFQAHAMNAFLFLLVS